MGFYGTETCSYRFCDKSENFANIHVLVICISFQNRQLLLGKYESNYSHLLTNIVIVLFGLNKCKTCVNARARTHTHTEQLKSCPFGVFHLVVKYLYQHPFLSLRLMKVTESKPDIICP